MSSSPPQSIPAKYPQSILVKYLRSTPAKCPRSGLAKPAQSPHLIIPPRRAAEHYPFNAVAKAV